MAANPVWLEGFDMYNGPGANVGAQALWVPNPLAHLLWSANVSMVPGRFGGQAIRIGHTGRFGNNSWTGALGTPLPTRYTEQTWCGTIRPALGAGDTGAFLNLYCTGAGGGMQLTGFITNLGELVICQGLWGTELGRTAPSTVLNNTWHFLEIEIVYSTTVGRVTMYIDGDYGTPALNLTNKNTNPCSTIGCNYLILANKSDDALGGGHSITYDVDDLYILDQAAYLEECWIETLRTANNNTVGSWTANTGAEWAAIGDTVVDGDGTYLASYTPGSKDFFGIVPLSSTPSHIYAVQPVFFGLKTDAVARSATVSLRSGATDYDPTAKFLAASYQRYNCGLNLTDPDTGVAWTPTGVNSLLIAPNLVT